MENLLAGAYLANGTIGNVGTPGAPIANFSLVVVPSQNSVTGTVVIKQAILGKNSNIIVEVKGLIHATGLGEFTQAVSLHGQYVQTVNPPEIGAFLANFSAHLSIDNAWNGKGGFSYYNHTVENVPVVLVKQEELV